MINIGIIIQARMGSTRLPGKILKKIGSKSLLEHILFRLKFLTIPSTIVIATSDQSQDDIVEKFCLTKGVNCFRGSEANVLERYYTCTKEFKFDHIVRLTADNPFTDMEELGRLIRFHIQGKYDYSYSTNNLPIGVGAEVFSKEALVRSYQEGTTQAHLEHVNEFILENMYLFKTYIPEIPHFKNYPEISLTVDAKSDYELACYVVDHSPYEYITTEEVVKLATKWLKNLT